MRIYAISDTHGYLPEIPSDADVIIHAGDICPDFNSGYHDKSGKRQAEWLEYKFLPWVPEDIPFIMVWGNHDYVGEKPGLWEFNFTIERPNLTTLRDQGCRLGDLDIWGTPWVPNLPYWAFHASDNALVERASTIPEGLDILISHGPPRGWGDYIPTSREHVGDRALRRRLEVIKPRVTLCGHIHEARGRWANGEVLNVSAVDATYNLRDHPWTLLHDFE